MKTVKIEQSYATFLCCQVYHKFAYRNDPDLSEGEDILIFAEPNVDSVHDIEMNEFNAIGLAEHLHEAYPENAIIGTAKVSKVTHNTWTTYDGQKGEDWWIEIEGAALFEHSIPASAPEGDVFEYHIDSLPDIYHPTIPEMEMDGDTIVMPCNKKLFDSIASGEVKDLVLSFATPLARLFRQIPNSIYCESLAGLPFYRVNYTVIIEGFFKKIRLTHGNKTITHELIECYLDSHDSSDPEYAPEDLDDVLYVEGSFFELQNLYLEWK